METSGTGCGGFFSCSGSSLGTGLSASKSRISLSSASRSSSVSTGFSAGTSSCGAAVSSPAGAFVSWTGAAGTASPTWTSVCSLPGHDWNNWCAPVSVLGQGLQVLQGVPLGLGTLFLRRLVRLCPRGKDRNLLALSRRGLCLHHRSLRRNRRLDKGGRIGLHQRGLGKAKGLRDSDLLKDGACLHRGDLHLRRRFGGRFLCLHRLRRRQGGLSANRSCSPASGRPLWPPLGQVGFAFSSSVISLVFFRAPCRRTGSFLRMGSFPTCSFCPESLGACAFSICSLGMAGSLLPVSRGPFSRSGRSACALSSST